nr:hypothetical protein [Tanacetum cinerariifolium]
MMIDYMSIVETDKVIHIAKIDMVKFFVEIESFSLSVDELDKENGSCDGLQPKQADMSCVHALNKPHFHEIHVVPKVMMIDYMSIVETDKVIHIAKIDMVKFFVEIESFSLSVDELDKENGSCDGLQPKQADMSCVHALNKPHFHEIHVVPRFPAQGVGSSNTDVLELPCLLVLITRTSQSRQHGKSESDSYYLSD